MRRVSLQRCDRWLRRPLRLPPTRPVLVLAKVLVVALAAPADASGLESSRDVVVGVVQEVWLAEKNGC